MDTAALSSGFFTSFAWNTFAQFRDVGIGLVVVLTLLALIVELVSVHKGGGMETSAVLVRAATAIFLLGCFQSIVEGAKDFVWSIEKIISTQGSIEQTISRFEQLTAKGSFWSGPMGRVRLMFAGWGMTLAHYVGEGIFWLYGVLWVCATVSAPLLIPAVVMETTQKIFRMFLFFILALLFVRIPWAMVSAVLAHLVDYLSTHGNGEQLRAFFLFWIALLVTIVTPIISTMAFLKMDAFIQTAVQAGKLGVQGVGMVANGAAALVGGAAWNAHKISHLAFGKELFTGGAAQAFEKRFGSYAKPPDLNTMDWGAFAERNKKSMEPSSKK